MQAHKLNFTQKNPPPISQFIVFHNCSKDLLIYLLFGSPSLAFFSKPTMLVIKLGLFVSRLQICWTLLEDLELQS